MSPHTATAPAAAAAVFVAPGGWWHGVRYGALGFPLAFVALPLYVMLPNHYATTLGVSLAGLGAVLLAARLLDAVVDPWIGRVCDGWFGRGHTQVLGWGAAMAVVLGLGLWALLFPPAAVLAAGHGAVLAWLCAMLVVASLAYSVLSVAHQAWGARLGGNEAERSRVLTLMQQQTDRMQALVADLLTLAQLEGSPRPSAEAWLPVRRLLAQALADGRALSAGRHAVALDGDLPSEDISGAPTELQSALGNLVTNAVRYTPEGGQVWMRWLRSADGGGVLEVGDNGPGIAREHLSRLTERFYRVDGGRSRDTGGTGLGLSIVKHVMQRHGGQIDIHSELGRGSTFRLLLPASRVRSGVALSGSGAAGPLPHALDPAATPATPALPQPVAEAAG